MGKNRKQNRYSRKYYMAVWLIVLLVSCAMLMNGITPDHRVALLLACAAVGCVWIWCEARIDRAAAPLNLPPEPVHRVDKPPEGADE